MSKTEIEIGDNLGCLLVVIVLVVGFVILASL